MSCGYLAMLKAEVPIDRYVAYEIDKYAVKTSKHNFPDIEHRGDVFDADFTEFEGFDFLVGGSPCTYWSIAQKNNRETEASGMGWELFRQYVRALNEAKPKYFIYENNKSMSKQIRASIDETFGFEAVCINSALVSAQNRNRLYWVGKRTADGTYRKVNVEQPEDRGILLQDILMSGVAEQDKSYCLKHQAGNARDYIKKHHTSVSFEPVCVAQRGRYVDENKTEQQFEVRGQKTNTLTSVQKDNMIAEPVGTTKDGKSYCVTANYCSAQGNDYTAHTLKYGTKSLVAQPVRVGALPRPNGELSDSQGMRIYSADGKSVNITSNGGGKGAKTGLYAVPTIEKDGKQYKVYEVKNGLITFKDKKYPIKLADGFYIIRKLTVTECMRLQTIPEWYEFPVSDTQAYKMLGNGWTVDVITHLIQSALRGNVEPKQMKFF